MANKLKAISLELCPIFSIQSEKFTRAVVAILLRL